MLVSPLVGCQGARSRSESLSASIVAPFCIKVWRCSSQSCSLLVRPWGNSWRFRAFQVLFLSWLLSLFHHQWPSERVYDSDCGLSRLSIHWRYHVCNSCPILQYPIKAWYHRPHQHWRYSRCGIVVRGYITPSGWAIQRAAFSPVIVSLLTSNKHDSLPCPAFQCHYWLASIANDMTCTP